MPAAARYSAIGEPRPPVPIQSTRAAFSFSLAFHADLGHDQMARVAQDLVFVERHWKFSGGGHSVLG